MREKFIPLSVPNLRGHELDYVIKAVETEWISTGGPYVNTFEENIATYVHVKGAVSCQNGTSGLHTSLLVTGVTKGEEVIVPTLTFIAAVNPIKYIGADPVFMDCDDTLCMDPNKLLKFCEDECEFDGNILKDKRNQKRVKAILVVHVFGNMADMESIMPIAKKYKLKVIEDATEALGTYYTKGKYAGAYAGTIGDIGVYSFNGNKIITTGGGGMIVSNNIEYTQRAKHLTTQAKSDELYYTHDEIGYNYRMTNLQAALGIAQLEQLENFIDVKNRNYMLYCDLLKGIEGLRILPFRNNIRSNKWFYSLVCEDTFKSNRDVMIRYFSEHSIQTRPVWGLISDQIPYQGSRAYQIEKARYFWKHIINLPCSTNLSTDDIKRVVSVLREN